MLLLILAILSFDCDIKLRVAYHVQGLERPSERKHTSHLPVVAREVPGEFLTFAMCINVSSSGFTDDGLEAPSVP